MTEKTAKKKVLVQDMTKAQYVWNEVKKNKVGYLMVAPFFLIFLTFTVTPVIMSVFYSFTNFNILEPPEWIAADNYIRLILDDDIFLIAIKNTLVFASTTGPVSYMLSLLIAWFINEVSPKIRSIVTLIFYAPSISGQVYLVWTLIFSGDQYGILNSWLMQLGLINDPVQWLKDTRYIMPICIIVALWTSLGTSFLSNIAGFQIIDKSLYEAGAVDGIKNRWQELWYITLPSMKPQLMFGAIMSITASFGFGAVVTGLVGFPSPEYAAHTIMHHLEDYGNNRFEMGYASAIATILFCLMIGANLLIRKILRKVGD